MAGSLMKKAEEQGEKEAEKIISESEKEAMSIKKESGGKIKAAADTIVNSVLEI